jgi:predicted RNA-binding protein YlqC (UPF0109 family)
VKDDLVEYIARHLVDEPDEVIVEEFEEDDGTVVIEVTTAPDDMGKVIGKNGRVARALRQLIRALGTREGVRATVDIVDELSEPEDED